MHQLWVLVELTLDIISWKCCNNIISSKWQRQCLMCLTSGYHLLHSSATNCVYLWTLVAPSGLSFYWHYCMEMLQCLMCLTSGYHSLHYNPTNCVYMCTVIANSGHCIGKLNLRKYWMHRSIIVMITIIQLKPCRHWRMDHSWVIAGIVFGLSDLQPLLRQDCWIYWSLSYHPFQGNKDWNISH